MLITSCSYCSLRIELGEAQAERCPRCKVMMVTISWAPATDLPYDQETDIFLSLPVNIRTTMRTYLQADCGQRVYAIILNQSTGDESTLAFWLPDELLTTREVAEIIEKSVDWISKLIRNERFSGAKRDTPSKKKYQHGRWLISRQDLWEYLHPKTQITHAEAVLLTSQGEEFHV